MERSKASGVVKAFAGNVADPVYDGKPTRRIHTVAAVRR
jgi:hypothetical protein